MKVLKFGGTSVKNAEAMKLAYEAVSLQEGNILVVLSACAGITDKLIEITALLPFQYDEAVKLYNQIEAHHLKLCEDLSLTQDDINSVESILKELADLIKAAKLLEYLSPNTENKIISKGEHLSTFIFSALIRTKSDEANLLDASEFIFIKDNDPKLYYIHNKDFLFDSISNSQITITQGYICSNQENQIRTLGRGGSDYSAAIFASELNAEELQIWTDVNGIMSGDPRFFKRAVTKPFVSFNTMRKMAFFGAKVLHPETVLPAVKANIPIQILNTFDSKLKGTKIISEIKEQTSPAFVVKNNCELFKLDLTGISRISNAMNVVYQNLAELRIEPLYSDLLDNNALFIFENGSNKIYKDKLFSALEYNRNVDVVYICELNESKLNLLLSKLINKGFLHFEVDTENGAILLILKEVSFNSHIEELHDLFVLNEE